MTPIQESELLLPTAEHIRDSEELLPCSCLEKYRHDGDHNSMCPAHYRPTIAQSLASRDAKHALEIAGRDARIQALEAALSLAVCMLAPYEPGDSRAVSDEFVTLAAIDCGLPDTEGAYAKIISDALDSIRARTALQRDTPAS